MIPIPPFTASRLPQVQDLKEENKELLKFLKEKFNAMEDSQKEINQALIDNDPYAGIKEQIVNLTKRSKELTTIELSYKQTILTSREKINQKKGDLQVLQEESLLLRQALNNKPLTQLEKATIQYGQNICRSLSSS